MDQYVVIGNPVEHSKSPRIHAEFARQTGQDMNYGKLYSELDDFETVVADFIEQGGKGANITVPFKERAWRLVEKHGEHARLAGAVNTLVLDATGSMIGQNTDGIGLVRDITDNHGGDFQDKRVLVLGAGGASRGILLPLLQSGAGEITIANRTPEKAHDLAQMFSQHSNNFGKLRGCGFDGVTDQQYDWVINATAASLQGSLPSLPDNLLASGAWCYDLMYSNEPTLFCQWAIRHGAARSLDGLGMLVEQAAESFYVWRKVRPDTAGVIEILKKAG